MRRYPNYVTCTAILPSPSRDAKAWRARVVAAAMLLSASLILPCWSQAAPQQAHNSRVVLDLPEGYAQAPQFSGFQHDRLGVSFVILEAPAKAYQELTAGFSSEQLASRGILDAQQGTLQRKDQYLYIRARQSAPLGDVAKFFVLFRTEDQSVLVSANVPMGAIKGGTVKPEDIERVLATAATAEKPAIRELYRFMYLGPFKEAGTIVGTSTLYTLDGRMEPERKGEARSQFVVAPSLEKLPVAEPETAAKTLLSSLTGFEDIRPEQPRPIKIAGLDGIEIEADAIETGGGKPMRLYQALLLPKDGGYFRLIGMATAADAEQLTQEFHKITESFVPVR